MKKLLFCFTFIVLVINASYCQLSLKNDADIECSKDRREYLDISGSPFSSLSDTLLLLQKKLYTKKALVIRRSGDNNTSVFLDFTSLIWNLPYLELFSEHFYTTGRKQEKSVLYISNVFVFKL